MNLAQLQALTAAIYNLVQNLTAMANSLSGLSQANPGTASIANQLVIVVLNSTITTLQNFVAQLSATGTTGTTGTTGASGPTGS
jgi:hypothetical protein